MDISQENQGAIAACLKEMGDAIVDAASDSGASTKGLTENLETLCKIESDYEESDAMLSDEEQEDSYVDDSKAMTFIKGTFNLPHDMPKHLVWEEVEKIVLKDIEKMEGDSNETEKLAKQVRSYLIKRRMMNSSSTQTDALKVLENAIQIEADDKETACKIIKAMDVLINEIKQEDVDDDVDDNDDLLLGARPLAKIMMH